MNAFMKPLGSQKILLSICFCIGFVLHSFFISFSEMSWRVIFQIFFSAIVFAILLSRSSVFEYKIGLISKGVFIGAWLVVFGYLVIQPIKGATLYHMLSLTESRIQLISYVYKFVASFFIVYFSVLLSNVVKVTMEMRSKE